MKNILTVLSAVFILCFSVVPCFAEEIDPDMGVMPILDYTPSPVEGYPDFPISFNPSLYPDSPYILCETSNGSTYLLQLEQPSQNQYVDVTYYNNELFVTYRPKPNSGANSATAHFVYWYYLENVNDTMQWTLHSSNAVVSTSFPGVSNFIYSDITIYDNVGNVVFPPAPSVVQVLAEKVPTLVIRPIMTYLGFLVPLGIGLMASLIGLNLLKKVLFKFL